MKNPLDDIFQDRLPKIIWLVLGVDILLIIGAAFIVLLFTE